MHLCVICVSCNSPLSKKANSSVRACRSERWVCLNSETRGRIENGLKRIQWQIRPTNLLLFSPLFGIPIFPLIISAMLLIETHVIILLVCGIISILFLRIPVSLSLACWLLILQFPLYIIAMRRKPIRDKNVNSSKFKTFVVAVWSKTQRHSCWFL